MKKISAFAGFALLLTGSAVFAQTTDSKPTTLSVNVGAEAALTVGDTPLSSSGGNFANYTGTTNFKYFIRTGASGGFGSINLQVTTDFGLGGPSVATPLTGDALTYTNTISTPGAAVVGAPTLTASTTATTGVATFAQDAHSEKAGNTGSTSWTLTNDPLYKTGSYTAVVTYTISAS